MGFTYYRTDTAPLNNFWRAWSATRKAELMRRGQPERLAAEQADFEAKGRQHVESTSGRKAALNAEWRYEELGNGKLGWWIEWSHSDVPQHMREQSLANSNLILDLPF